MNKSTHPSWSSKASVGILHASMWCRSCARANITQIVAKSHQGWSRQYVWCIIQNSGLKHQNGRWLHLYVKPHDRSTSQLHDIGVNEVPGDSDSLSSKAHIYCDCDKPIHTKWFRETPNVQRNSIVSARSDSKRHPIAETNANCKGYRFNPSKYVFCRWTSTEYRCQVIEHTNVSFQNECLDVVCHTKLANLVTVKACKPRNTTSTAVVCVSSND